MKELVDRQRNDVQRAFIGVESAYVVRKEYEKYKDDTFFRQNPGNRVNKGKAIVQPESYRDVLNYKSKPSNSRNSDHNSERRNLENAGDIESLCQKELAGTFTKSDIQAVAVKAKNLVVEKGITAGFEPHTLFVKSTSKASPHLVKSSSGKYMCDNDCLGFKTRNICAHVVAAAATQGKLKEFLANCKACKKAPTLTSLVANNKNAGLKRPRPTKGRPKSPDAMSSMKQNPNCSATLGDILNEDQTDEEYSAASSSQNPLKITIRKNRPPKPEVNPTTNTPFQLINITGRIRKCAGCGGALKEGPDPFSKEDLDQKLCIRHKEHDFVWIQNQSQWKPTFENKHYHIFPNCISSRNKDTFDVSLVQIELNHTLNQMETTFIKQRFRR